MRARCEFDLDHSFQTAYIASQEIMMPAEKSFSVTDVLDKAMQAFWARGYEATSIQDLVNRTGINRASLYATFGDKRTLFVTALNAYDERIRRAKLSELDRNYPPRETIRRLFQMFADNACPSGGNNGCFLTNTALELSDHDPEIKEIVARSQQEMETFIARQIVKGKEQGDITTTEDPTELARALLATLIGLIVLTRSRPDRGLLMSIVNGTMRRLD